MVHDYDVSPGFPSGNANIPQNTAKESLHSITSMGEIDMDELLDEGNSIYLITPYEKVEINYIKKHKLYY